MYGDYPDPSKKMRKLEEERQKQLEESIAQINAQFDRFGPDFYQRREQAYLDYALPEIAEQYGEARRNLVYSLARRGLRRSGAAATETGDLMERNLEMQRRAAQQGILEANKLKSDVEGRRMSLMQLAQAGIAPQSVAISALNTASQFQQPSIFAPLGQMFSDVADIAKGTTLADAFKSAEQAPLRFDLRSPVSTVRS